MKLRLFILLLMAVALRAADQVPLFNATLTVGKEHRFVLVGAAGTASSWLKLGDRFEGYTVKAFDSTSSTLELEHGGTMILVKLVDSAKVTNAPVPSKETAAFVTELLTAMEKADYDAFIAFVTDRDPEATQEMKKSFPRKQFDLAAVPLAPMLRGGYKLTYLSDQNRQDHHLTSWKISFNDGSADAIATLAVKAGKVGAFYVEGK